MYEQITEKGYLEVTKNKEMYPNFVDWVIPGCVTPPHSATACIRHRARIFRSVDIEEILAWMHGPDESVARVVFSARE